MENQEVLRNKPLSYEASKAVLKSLSLEKREAINRRIPTFRTINSRLPYVLVNVVIGHNFFETNERRWHIGKSWEQSNSLREVVNPEKSAVIIHQGYLRKETKYCVNKSPEEVYEQLFDEYIRYGTVVRRFLHFWGTPEFLKRRREKEDDLKMKVTNLELRTNNAEDYDHFIWFIEMDALENVKFFHEENSLVLLDKPEIKTCKKLTFIVNMGLMPPSVDKFFRLRNQHLRLSHVLLPLHDLQLFVEDWITNGREIGTRFTWGQIRFEGVCGILEHLMINFGAVEAGSNLENYFSSKSIHGSAITLKMGEDRELVMFCEDDSIPSHRFSYYQCTFKMEVVSSIIAADNMPTRDV